MNDAGGVQERRSRPDHVFVQVPPQPTRGGNSFVMYGRLVVIFVVAWIVAIAAVAAAIGILYAGTQQTKPPHEIAIGPWTATVSADLPPDRVVIMAVLAMIGLAATAVTFEAIAAVLSVGPRHQVLSRRRGPRPRQVMAPGDVRITVLVPAHDEEFSLPTTLGALKDQSRPPDRVIVVADNCTDRTVEIARSMGFEAFETVDNDSKKAGALNQVLTRILPDTAARDVVMVMDADTSLSPRFLDVAADQLARDPELCAVGGIFFGEDGHGLVGQFQRNEYTRYFRQIQARHGRVFVLTGTATMFRADALLDVAAARGVFIPGATGQVYDTAALTEDNEFTLALKSLGATMTSPPECMVTTELMPTWRNLWVQRQRWQRGALENLSSYGITRATLRYWGQQVGIAYGAVALWLAILLMVVTILAVDNWIWFPFWLVIGLIFVLERVATVWRGGWKARLLAASLLPELGYDVFLQIVFYKCLLDIALARRPSWGHVQHPTAPLDAP